MEESVGGKMCGAGSRLSRPGNDHRGNKERARAGDVSGWLLCRQWRDDATERLILSIAE
jgi:hypothetical protein